MSYEVIIDLSDVEHRSFDFKRMFDESIPCKERIVRCRDCRHMQTIDLSVYYGEHKHDFDMCTRVDGVQLNAEPDGFCAWGERKADA